VEPCADLQECGEQEGFPDYYDFGNSPGSLYFMVRIAVIQGFLYSFIFHNRNSAYLQEKNGGVRPKMRDQFDYFSSDMPEWL